jgi:hypothetical protein
MLRKATVAARAGWFPLAILTLTEADGGGSWLRLEMVDLRLYAGTLVAYGMFVIAPRSKRELPPFLRALLGLFLGPVHRIHEKTIG